MLQDNIEKHLYKGKVIILYGARQVGKTVLSKKILEVSSKKGRYLNGDEPSVVANLTNRSSMELKNFIGDYELVVIDEAQRIENIGITLKLLVENYPEMQIIATGSSSFDLANKISEPLTGRSRTFHLEPLSFVEITQGDRLVTDQVMKRMLIFGSYPMICNMSDSEAVDALTDLSSNYLFKDILKYENLKKAPLLTKLLQALALQLGNEVSLSELSNLLEVDIKTIERYIFLLEQTFVIYRLPALKRNPRNEVGKLRKIYFIDLGLRNSLIRNFNELDLRNDVGALWENFCVTERIKSNEYGEYKPNYFFWRSYSQKEIDLVEEYSGKVNAFEFKWKEKQAKLPNEFNALYPENTFTVITNNNFVDTLFSRP
ncbi:ATP-binding protein [Patescibacteria group bacterium]|nr:ATP-binding protein [Patescibacteria group bacterium]